MGVAVVRQEFEHMLEQGIIQSVVIPIAYGAKEDSWGVATLWRLSGIEQDYNPGQIPDTSCPRFYNHSPKTT